MTDPITRLRPAGAIRFYGECKPWCEPDEDGNCTCGYEALLDRLREIRESEDADRRTEHG